MANVLFESGYRNQAIDILRGEIADGSNLVNNHVALGVALAKMALWPEANESFLTAFQIEGMSDTFEMFFPRSNRAEIRVIEEICPPSFAPYIERLSHFDIVRLLGDVERRVYYSRMKKARPEWKRL